MSKGMTSEEARKFLPAFADGELDVEQNLRVLEQMAMDPTNTKRVMHQQQLKQACARVMDSPDMRCPDALRQQLLAMADAPDGSAEDADTGNAPGRSGVDDALASSDNHERPAVLATIGRWVAPLAIAAAVGLAAAVTLNAYNTGNAEPGGGYTADGIMTASLAETFGKRHAQCSLKQSLPKQTELFPAEVDQLDQTLVQHVGQDIDGAALDLTTVGYDYQIAGFCPLPGGDSVHVIYENPDGHTLSLWIKRYDGKPVLDPGVPYVPPSDHTTKPMMVWREAGMVFYLVGDTMDDVKQAQPEIHLAASL